MLVEGFPERRHECGDQDRLPLCLRGCLGAVGWGHNVESDRPENGLKLFVRVDRNGRRGVPFLCLSGSGWGALSTRRRLLQGIRGAG